MARMCYLWLLGLFHFIVVVVVTRPLPNDSGMVEDNELRMLDNFLETRPKIVEIQRVAKERATQRVRSWAVQNKMRGVPCRMTTSAA